MFKSHRIATISLAIAGAIVLYGGAVHAADFSNAASFSGSYAHTAAVGTDVAVVGICTADGAGNFSCPEMKRNRPGTETERTLDTLSIVGTYAFNADGSGSLSETLTFADGNTAQVNSDLVVTSAVTSEDGTPIIVSIDAVQREPVPGGALLTSSFFRLPD